MIIVNRILALCSIWTTAVLTVQWKASLIEVCRRADNLQAIGDLIPHMIYVRDGQGRFVMANQKAAEEFGVPLEELVSGKSTWMRTDSVEETARQEAEKKVRDQETQMVKEEEVFTNQLGETRFHHTTRLPYHTAYSMEPSVLTVAIDQTDQKQLQQTMALAKQVFDSSSDHIAVLGRDYRYRQINPAYEKAHGVALKEIVGLRVPELLGEDVYQQVIKPRLDQCLAGENVSYESWFDFKKAGRCYMNVTYMPLRTSQNQVEGVIVVARNLTELKQAELKRAELEHAVDHAMEGLSLHDKEGNITYVNPAEAKMYGYTIDELMGKSWKMLYEKEQITQIEKEVFPLVQEQGKWKGCLIGRRKSGSFFNVEVSLTLLKHATGTVRGLLCTCRDITEEMSVQNALRESERQFRDLYESAPLAFFSVSFDGQITRVNSKAEELLGYPKDELLGAQVLSLYALTENGQAKAAGLQKQAQAGKKLWGRS